MITAPRSGQVCLEDQAADLIAKFPHPTNCCLAQVPGAVKEGQNLLQGRTDLQGMPDGQATGQIPGFFRCGLDRSSRRNRFAQLAGILPDKPA